MERITDPGIIEGYLTDASNTRGHAEVLVRPRSTAEVAGVLGHCQRHRIPVTVTAQRTSTTGGPVPRGGWLLSTEKLSRIHGLNEAEGGVLLGAYQSSVETAGRMFPPDPTSRHDCSLGAAIACNASGPRTFRYGPCRPWIEAVEAVLPTGQVIEADRDTPIPTDWPRLAWTPPSVKTAAGYEPADNLLDLLVGQEGTLAIITRARLRLTDLPPGVLALVAFFPSMDAAITFVERARQGAARPGRPARTQALDPRALELLDQHCLELIRARIPDTPTQARAALMVEIEHTGEPPLEVWSDALSDGGALVDHTLLAIDASSRAKLQALRHSVPSGVNEAVVRNGMPKVGTDFAVPDHALAPMVRAYQAVTLPHLLFGHVGDNHLHLNLLPRNEQELVQAHQVTLDLARLALSLGGTVSAEHGIGKLKRALLAEMVGAQTIETFRALKAAVDPGWILGRGNLFEAP